MPPSNSPIPYLLNTQSLGWLIVGASNMAEQRVIPAIRQQPTGSSNGAVDCWVVGIHSHQRARAEQFANRLQIPHADDDLRSLLHRPDVRCVYVGNHPRHHGESVRAALLAGKHVLCEPPLDVTVAEAQALLRLATESHLALGINFAHRCDPILQQLSQLIAADEIGDLLGGSLRHLHLLEIKQQSWRLQAPFGGIINTDTVFGIDLLRFVLGDEVRAVRASAGQQLLGEAVTEELFAEVQMQRTHSVVQIHHAWQIPHVSSRLELYGTQASLIVNHWAEVDQPSELLLVRNRQVRPLARHSTPPIDPVVEMIASFQRAVRSASQPIATAQDGVQSLRVTNAMHESLRQRSGLVACDTR